MKTRNDSAVIGNAGTRMDLESFGSRQPRKQTVLVAEDNEGIRAVMVDTLEDAGFDVHPVSDGQAAWEALRRGNFDMLVTDNQMPRLSGLDLIRWIRDAGMNLPIVVASGSFTIARVDNYSQLQISAVISKPFHLGEFVSVVRAALQSQGKSGDTVPEPEYVSTAS